ncbi:MAG: BrnT family toxin [Selenomonadaceae bacterium]|nr:BrnT family toxin [Selenomonadaceae bacterium]
MNLNVYYELGVYKFVWDSEKAEINKKKHKVSFETADRVFLDKNYIDYFDELHSDFEDRIQIIGKVGNILTVIYTERGNMDRIISARRATKDEEEKYYEQFY